MLLNICRRAMRSNGWLKRSLANVHFEALIPTDQYAGECLYFLGTLFRLFR